MVNPLGVNYLDGHLLETYNKGTLMEEVSEIEDHSVESLTRLIRCAETTLVKLKGKANTTFLDKLKSDIDHYNQELQKLKDSDDK